MGQNRVGTQPSRGSWCMESVFSRSTLQYVTVKVMSKVAYDRFDGM